MVYSRCSLPWKFRVFQLSAHMQSRSSHKSLKSTANNHALRICGHQYVRFRMATITDLPTEIIALVLRQLDDIKTLPTVLQACRHFYASYREQPGLKEDVLRNRIGDALLPAAVAVELLKAPEVTQGSGRIRGILEALYSVPTRLTAKL